VSKLFTQEYVFFIDLIYLNFLLMSTFKSKSNFYYKQDTI